MAARAVTALFDSYEAAADAVEALEAAGIPHADISILASDSPDRPRASPPGTSSSAGQAEANAAGGLGLGGKPIDGAGTGATVGTVLGGGAGLLAGLGLLAIPGLGPVIAAGWLVAAVMGAGVGAAAGGLIGGLTAAGLNAPDAEAYAEGVRRGGTLVTVRADEASSDRVLATLDRAGSIDLDERAEGWRAEGWQGADRQGADRLAGDRRGEAPGARASGWTGGTLGPGAAAPGADETPGPTQTFGGDRR